MKNSHFLSLKLTKEHLINKLDHHIFSDQRITVYRD
jgi:hypothetical protein